MNKNIQAIVRFLRLAARNPKTTTAGIAGIFGGVSLLRQRKVAEGMTSIVLGAGFLASVDAEEANQKGLTNNESNK